MAHQDFLLPALEQLKHPSLGRVLGVLAAAYLLYQALSIFYCLYLHPLASYPGPFLARCTRLWYVYHLVTGNLPFAAHKAHLKYGDILRLAPDELSYVDADAWKSIYGFKHGTGGEMPKDPGMYGNTSAGALSIFSAPSPRHGELRRLLSHGFSEKALRSQEPIIQHYLDLFIRRLRDLGSKGEVVDIVDWYNFFTFDVIADLAFAKPFNCLETSKSHPWIDFTFEVLKMQTMMRASDNYPLFKRLVLLLAGKGTAQGFQSHVQYVKQQALGRLNLKTDRLDLMSKMAAPGSGVSVDEFIATSDTVILGGSETTATLLSGLTYFLVKNPRILQKLVEEIRNKFKSEEEIDFQGVNSLDYMLACINEAFRLYPPVPGALLRKTREGDTICGKYVPPNIVMGIHQWAMYRNPAYFVNPEDYVPERWSGEGQYKDDCLTAVQAFSYGPRNCIGRNLAYVEMRLALARLLFNFDLEGTPEAEGWTDQSVFLMWQKKPLLIKLVPRDVKSRKEVVGLAGTG